MILIPSNWFIALDWLGSRMVICLWVWFLTLTSSTHSFKIWFRLTSLSCQCEFFWRILKVLFTSLRHLIKWVMLLIIHFIKHFRQLNVHVRGPLYNVHTMSIRMGHWINPVPFRSTQSFSLFGSIRPNIVHIIYSTHMCVLVACTTHRSTTMKPEKKSHGKSSWRKNQIRRDHKKRSTHTHTHNVRTKTKRNNYISQCFSCWWFFFHILHVFE